MLSRLSVNVYIAEMAKDFIVTLKSAWVEKQPPVSQTFKVVKSSRMYYTLIHFVLQTTDICITFAPGQSGM